MYIPYTTGDLLQIYMSHMSALTEHITSNHRQTGVNGVWVLICEGAIVNRI